MEENKNQITVFLEPDGKTLTLPRPKSVLQLLNRLDLRPTACLVIRHPSPALSSAEAPQDPAAEKENWKKGQLLTHDLRIMPDDVITVRKVASSG